MKVWKVVKVKNGKLFSAIARVKAGGVEYRVGERTKPVIENSPLMAFASFHDARRFRDRESQLGGLPLIIFEARATRSKTLAVWFPTFIRDASKALLRLHWSGRPHEYSGSTCLPPSGTIFCSSITLLRKEEED